MSQIINMVKIQLFQNRKRNTENDLDSIDLSSEAVDKPNQA